MSFQTCFLACTSLLCIVGCHNNYNANVPQPPARYDKAAAAKFAQFIEDGLPAVPKKEIEEVFKRSFPTGLPATKVEEILRTATRIEATKPNDNVPPGADMMYQWQWNNGGVDAATIEVYVGYNAEGNRTIVGAWIYYLPG